MGFFQKIDKHMDLVGRMAGTLHVDFATSIEQGRMSGEDLRSAVLRCMNCTSTGDCRDWLAAHAGGAEAAPGYCRNRDLMGRLAG